MENPHRHLLKDQLEEYYPCTNEYCMIVDKFANVGIEFGDNDIKRIELEKILKKAISEAERQFGLSYSDKYRSVANKIFNKVNLI